VTQSNRRKEESHQMIRTLKFEISRFPETKRIAFIEELLSRKELMSIAFELIPTLGDKNQISKLKDQANALINTVSSDDPLLDELMRAVLGTYQKQDKDLISRYYVQFQEIRFIRVPIELYDIDMEIFLEAFEKCIENYPLDELCNYDAFLYLVARQDALEYLIKNLSFFPSHKMQIFCLAKSNHSTVKYNPSLKSKLLELAGLKESEIDLIKKRRISDYDKLKRHKC
jgi:hypothetical protein